MSENRFLCQIHAAAEGDQAEILIYDEIGASFWGEGVSAKQFVKDLAGLEASQITVRINSAGGDVFDGLAIYNALRRHDASIVTQIDSLAASIASIIALAGEDVRMADNAFFMIHDPSGIEWGTAEDMRKMADLLDKVGGSLANVYADKTGKPVAEIQDWMKAETWFDGEEAKAAGFVDALFKGKKIEARADLSAFHRIPEALRPSQEPEPHEPPAAAGGPAPDSLVAPTEPAVKAQEGTMSEQDAAAQAAALETARAEERQRVSAIRALGREHSVPQDQIDKWTDEGSMTVARVKDEILERIRAEAAEAPPVRATLGAPRAERDPQKGFQSHRDFLVAVMENRGMRSRADVTDERLRPLAQFDKDDQEAAGELAFMLPAAFTPRSIRATVGSDEQGDYADPYGGYLVPKSTAPGLMRRGWDGDPTVGRTTMVPMATPQLDLNARTDHDHSSSVSGGLTVSRREETGTMSGSRMATEMISLKAASLYGAAFATEEILSDSAISFAALIAAGFDDQFAAHMLNEKLRGLSGNEYEGVLTAGCAVTVAKESGQAADTIVSNNVIKMAARAWGFSNAIWMANHNCKPQLAVLSIAVGTGGTLIYQPSREEGFPDMLWGRPIFYNEYMSSIGDLGDIALINWSQYLEGLYQPLQSAESIHVRFLNHERAFKFWLRNAGRCWWRAALTPAKGSTLSPIVLLAAR